VTIQDPETFTRAEITESEATARRGSRTPRRTGRYPWPVTLVLRLIVPAVILVVWW